MNFDRDGMYGAYYDTSSFEGGLNSLAVATTGSGVGAGLGYRQFGDEHLGWWSFTSGASLRVSKGLAIGSAVHWQLPEGGNNNFASWDIGAGLRPAPFLGVGASVQNVGSPAPDLGVVTKYNAGVALRPWADTITVGLDWGASAPPEEPLAQFAGVNARIHPSRGIWVRGWGEVPFEAAQGVRAGGALELRFADLGVGLVGRGEGTAGGGAYVVTIPRDDQVLRSGKDVASFDLDRPYGYNPRGNVLTPAPEGYLALLRRLRDAGSDPQVRGLLLEVGDAGFSFAQIEELRGLIADARKNGKPVVAYLSEGASNGAYLLAAACEKVYLHPAGGVDLIGVGAELQFFRGTLDLVGVQAQYAKRAEFKSAPEQFTNTSSSDANREEMNKLLDDLYATLVHGVATGRGKTDEEIRTLIDGGPFTGDEAVAAGLVDGLVYPDELERTLSGAFGLFPNGYNTVDDYAEMPDQSGWAPQRAIAIVTVDGPISTGASSPGSIISGGSTGSETVVQALDQARRATAVKAVVLRVDSPGGSSFASDEIWRAVERLKKEGKPVIVSMGGYAASGGYYVSAGADSIYALPTTITGSIGVYGGKFNAQGLFDKLQLQTERFDRGRNASMYSLSVPLDEVQFAALDHSVGETYRQFKEKVQQGRGLTPEKVEEVARGRVWSGSAAKERGLVDEFGGLFAAVDAARAKAGMAQGAPYELITFDPWGGGAGGELPARVVRAAIGRRLAGPTLEDASAAVPEEVREAASLWALRDEHIFAMLPYRLKIE
jgi:protease-4